METLLQDLKYALRNLTRRPGFAAVAVFSLALGMGVRMMEWNQLHMGVDMLLIRGTPPTD